MGSLYAKISVSEVDVTSVKRRQKAKVTFDALPNLTITGRVSRIDPSGTNDQGVVTFDVNIAFDVHDKRLKPGMSASTSIVTAVAQDAILVPSAAVETTGGVSYVQVVSSSQATTAQTVSVTTGLSNDTMVQIKSGLKSGQYVVTGQRVDQTTAGSSGSSFGLPGMGGSRPSGSSSSGSSSGSSGSKSSGSGSQSGGQGPPPGM
jgi:macrolide-specific efflux system membrane fusion protein